MPKYRVYYERTEVEYAIIEAESAKDAEVLADLNYSDYDWKECDGTLTRSILTCETIKEFTDERA